ncbi:MAG TPA: PAS domain-containing protein, partial [Thermoanaerobaculia bacterium]|nr:PAS domain-containing protein [Thermoanaerobaculia bacterium]
MRDPLDIVAGTADAAFGSDEEGRIVIWNRSAERLLGYGAAEVLGKSCHDILCGRDPFGNRFCDQNCALERMVRRHEAVRHFELSVRRASGQVARVAVSVVVVPGPRPTQHTILHLLQPLPSDSESAARPVGKFVPLAATPAELAATAEVRHQPLTVRETEILRLLADGIGTEEIADSL